MTRIIQIDDFNAPELDVYARLTENQLINRREPEKGLFIAETARVIERALDADCVPESFLMEERHVEGRGKEILARCPGVPVYVSSLEVLKQLTGFNLTRGMLCAMRRPRPRTLEEVCEGARRVAVLEDVMNPTNLGAIFRSAAALNIDAVLLTRASTNPLYRRALRVSVGTIFQIPWAFVDEDWTARLKALGFTTAAMALSDEALLLGEETLREQEKLAIVLGTEGDGLAAGTIAECDCTVKIPMAHGVDSLNVAAASAVVFWELRARTEK